MLSGPGIIKTRYDEKKIVPEICKMLEPTFYKVIQIHDIGVGILTTKLE